jgi:2-dehydro-3-deoxyphosphogluconate aldolase/(4S)-4-hydroxy-2-oxoglutarate aldolase
MVMFDEGIAKKIEECGVVAVLTVERAEDAVPLAHALLEGGVEAMELTLRTPAAVDALRAVVAEVPEVLAGVGTVLTPAQVAAVHEAGAAFAVAPGTNPTVLQAAKELGLSFAPGVATPSEIEQALELGCRILKFFPAEPIGGLAYLKSMAAPYAHLGMRFMPLGGVNAQNMADYMKSPLVLGVGGSWIATKETIKARDWATITVTARQATETARKVRGKG